MSIPCLDLKSLAAAKQVAGDLLLPARPTAPGNRVRTRRRIRSVPYSRGKSSIRCLKLRECDKAFSGRKRHWYIRFVPALPGVPIFRRYAFPEGRIHRWSAITDIPSWIVARRSSRSTTIAIRNTHLHQGLHLTQVFKADGKMAALNLHPAGCVLS
jgi:hypothetical protein